MSTKDDASWPQEFLDKLEKWAAQQGTPYNMIIEGVNENCKGIKEKADDFDNIVQYLSRTNEGRSKEQYFTELALDCERHLNVHKE